MLVNLITLAAGDAPLDPLGHVLDKDVIGSGYFALTMNTIMMVVAGAVAVGLTWFAGKAIATGPESLGNERYVTKGRFAQIFEVFVLYLRDEVVRPNLGDQSNKWMPFLLTTFFFILSANFLGLVPLIDLQYLVGKLAIAVGLYEGSYTDFKVVGGTATGRWTTTLALATIAFIAWTYQGIRQMGVGGFFGHFTGGVPASMWPLWIIMIPVEIIGTFVKPAALTIRLFANMTAGHILLAVLIGFSGLGVAVLSEAFGATGGFVLSLPVIAISIVASVAIFFLEVFVALLQAFIFMFLTTIFIAQMSHHHDDHEHDHAEHDAHEPVPAGAVPA
ncbi:MAG: F0F1 ATP synthase subunit A [Planctomycetota bacterium]